jgi:hypothetical protein
VTETLFSFKWANDFIDKRYPEDIEKPDSPFTASAKLPPISARVKIDRITARERGVMRRSKSRPPDSCFTRHGCLRG